jgi:hypothetical protein
VFSPQNLPTDGPSRHPSPLRALIGALGMGTFAFVAIYGSPGATLVYAGVLAGLAYLVRAV